MEHLDSFSRCRAKRRAWLGRSWHGKESSLRLSRCIRWLLLAWMLVIPACGGAARPRGCPEAGAQGGGIDGCGGEQPSWCREIRVEGEFSKSWLPPRPFSLDATNIYVTYYDRYLGIVWQTFSRETGQQIAVGSYGVCPANLNPIYCGLDAVARNPQGDIAVAFGYMDSGIRHDSVLSISGGSASQDVWTPPWATPWGVWGLGWDGEGFTASLLDFDARWAAARFSPKGEMLTDMEIFGQGSTSFGYYDTETDSQSGTTVFAGGGLPGVVVVGRRGRDTSLTGAAPWRFSTSEWTSGWATAVALSEDTVLVVCEEAETLVREISLETGELLRSWTFPTEWDIVAYKLLAAARAGNRWIIVGSDGLGLVLAEIRDNTLQQRRILRHAPAACIETKTCDQGTEYEWDGRQLSLAVDGDSVWAGIIDLSTRRYDNGRTLFPYRMLPLAEGCEYESLWENK